MRIPFDVKAATLPDSSTYTSLLPRSAAILDTSPPSNVEISVSPAARLFSGSATLVSLDTKHDDVSQGSPPPSPLPSPCSSSSNLLDGSELTNRLCWAS